MLENTIKISPSADVYAFGEYSRSQLKFDISGIPSGSNIISAKLWLYRFAADNWDGDITVYRVDDQTWGEVITASEFEGQNLTNGENHTGKFMSYGWDYLDVLDQLRVDHGAGRTYTSFRLRWANDNGSEPSIEVNDGRFLAIESQSDNLLIVFYSREYNGGGPYLKVTCILPRAVSVFVLPENQSGLPCTTLNYTVTVKNTGNLGGDNYKLTKGDNAGWGDNIWLDNNQFLNVPQGENRTTTLHVYIPDNAIGCTIDNIWVAAKKVENENVKDNASCIAYVTSARGVQVVIEPPSQENENGGTLTYTVTVKNTGNMGSDNYDLTVSDNAIPSWGPTLDNKYLEIPAGENRTTTLRITIPGGAENCMRDNITVTAISRADNFVRDNASCIAHAAAAQPPPPPPPPDNMPPSTPSLVSPTNGANITDNTPPLDWSDVSDPSGVTYDVCIARDAGFVSVVLQKTGLTASAYELTSAEALAASTYRWRARAVDGTGNVGSWSENWSFTVSIAPPPPGDNTSPPTPSLVSPANGANITDNTPLLDWSDVSDPSGVTYNLSIAMDAGFVSTVLQKTGLTASVYELTPAEALAAGTYRWRARAVDGTGNVGSWSENWSFTVSIAPSPPVSVEISLITAIALLVVAMIAAVALYLIKRRKRHISGPRHGVLRRTRR